MPTYESVNISQQGHVQGLDTRPKPKPRQKPPVPPSQELPVPSSQELPEIEEHLAEFRKLLKLFINNRDGDINTIAACSLNFTARVLDSRGGSLLLKSHGVTLYIPPNALDTEQVIYVYVQRTLQPSPDDKSDGFVTPVVHCGTSGLKFNLPVILTFPVNVKDSSQWELNGVGQDSSTEPWTDISDCSRSDSVLFHDGLCTVTVDHFTGFAVVGRPSERRGASGTALQPLRVGVFNPQKGAIDPRSGCLQLRVRIWDESPQTVEV